jgi:hypothetical protein
MDGSVVNTRARIRFFSLLSRLDLVESVIVRRLLWTICSNLEKPAGWRNNLVLGIKQESAFRSVDLRQELLGNDDDRNRYAAKLATVTAAIINTLGAEQVAAGLQRLAVGHGLLSIDQIWQELAADRTDELTWFRDEVLLGAGVPAPRLLDVASEETEQGWRLRITLVNEGDALTVAPLRLVCDGDTSTVRARLPAQQQVSLTRLMEKRPDQVLLDPDRAVLRRQHRHGNHWRRGRGVQ